MRFSRLVLATALPVAAIPALAAAQPRAAEPVPTVDLAAPVGQGVELGVGSTLVLIYPAFGGHVSWPVHDRTRIEAGAHLVPWLLEDGDDVAFMTQVQLRIPLRDGPPGSRRSVLAGVTAFTIGDRYESIGNWSFDTLVRPHVGVSWQWQQTPRLDMRFDVQGAVMSTTAPFVTPFATFSMVWHKARRWS